jgi:hypothetical protein
MLQVTFMAILGREVLNFCVVGLFGFVLIKKWAEIISETWSMCLYKRQCLRLKRSFVARQGIQFTQEAFPPHFFLQDGKDRL